MNAGRVPGPGNLCRPVRALARQSHVPLLVGSDQIDRSTPPTRYYNSAFLVRPDGSTGAVYRKMLDQHGFYVFDYGNFPREQGAPTAWETYDSRPRFGTNYYGLRGRISVIPAGQDSPGWMVTAEPRPPPRPPRPPGCWACSG